MGCTNEKNLDYTYDHPSCPEKDDNTKDVDHRRGEHTVPCAK